MTNWGKELAMLLVSVLAAAYLVPNLPSLPSNGLLGVIQNPSVLAVLFALLIFLVLRGLYTGITRAFQDSQLSRGVGATSSRSPPSNEIYRIDISYLGVVWRAQNGYNRRSGNYTYVHDPMCLKCLTELDTKTRRKYVLWTAKQWRCPSCGYTTAKGSRSDSRPRKSVERIVEGELADRVAQLAGEESLKDVEGGSSAEDRDYKVVNDHLDNREARKLLN